MCAFFASASGFVSRSGPIVPVVPAGLKVWQLAQALARKTDFPFAELLDAGFVFVVVATLVVATVVDVAGAATVMVRVTVRPPELECPIAQPTTPAGTSNAKNRSQTKTSPTVTAGSRFRSAATAERYRPVPARVGTRTIRLLAAMIRRETLKPCPQRGEWSLVAFPPKRDSDPLCRASKNGRQRSIAGGGEYRLGWCADAIDTGRASRRVGRADASSSWPARCLGQVSVFRADWAEKRAWKGATFQRFAAWLRRAGYVSAFSREGRARRSVHRVGWFETRGLHKFDPRRLGPCRGRRAQLLWTSLTPSMRSPEVVAGVGRPVGYRSYGDFAIRPWP